MDPAAAFAGRVLDDAAAHSQPKLHAAERDPLLVSHEGVTGPAMAVPLRTHAQFWGVLCIARSPDGERFSPAEIEGAADLASRASIALELARAGEDARRALLADDRRRIARDLHDHVIQQLFGAGLGLQALASRLGPGPDGDSLGETIDQLDDAIGQIRTVIFALSHRDDASVAPSPSRCRRRGLGVGTPAARRPLHRPCRSHRPRSPRHRRGRRGSRTPEQRRFDTRTQTTSHSKWQTQDGSRLGRGRRRWCRDRRQRATQWVGQSPRSCGASTRFRSRWTHRTPVRLPAGRPRPRPRLLPTREGRRHDPSVSRRRS